MIKILQAITFSAGLLLAGSEGPLFPWINFFGVGVFGTTAILMRRFV